MAYNKTGSIRTLEGNWQEEAVLKVLTGTKTVGSASAATDSIYATRTDTAAAAGPTHTRVVEHSEQLLPSEWRTSSSVCYQAPAARSHELASYTPTKQIGPREMMETQALLKAARVSEAPAAGGNSLETTHQAEFKAHDLSGLNVGARVMKTPTGGSVQRDPTFLSEAKLVSPGMAGRMGGFAPDTSLLKARMGDPSIPITVYTEAAAKSTFNGHFYGTATLNKFQPMNRNDQFTKVMGDVNKHQEGL